MCLAICCMCMAFCLYWSIYKSSTCSLCLSLFKSCPEFQNILSSKDKHLANDEEEHRVRFKEGVSTIEPKTKSNISESNWNPHKILPNIGVDQIHHLITENCHDFSSPLSSSSSSPSSGENSEYLDHYYKNYDSDDSFCMRAIRKSSCPPTLN